MTIRHIVLWKLAAEDADTRALHAEQIAEKLLSLPAQIAQIRRMEVGPNVAYPQQNWDVALVADFDDVDAIETYKAHPLHLAVGEFIHGVVTERASIDIPA